MDKVDKGFELIYWKLSYRRKFIRTLWLIPWAVASLVYIQIVGKNYVYTMIAGIIYIVLLPIQVAESKRIWQSCQLRCGCHFFADGAYDLSVLQPDYVR